MRILLTALRSIPKFLNWLLLASLIILLVKVSFLDNIPALFPKAHEIGEMVNDILIANIAGYVFFILSAEIPKVIDTREKGKEVMSWAETIANNVTGFLQMLYNNNMEHHPSEERILNVQRVDLELVKREFALVSPTALAPMCDGYEDGNLAPQLFWLGAMATHDKWMKKSAKKIWKRYPFFDPELSELLKKLENSPHTYGMDDTCELTLEILKKGGTLNNPDLTSWSQNYYECYEIARDLRNYCTNFRTKYSIPK